MKVPTGTYYLTPRVSAPLVSLTPSTSDITIVGDGPGLTILKILNDVYYEADELWAAIYYTPSVTGPPFVQTIPTSWLVNTSIPALYDGSSPTLSITSTKPASATTRATTTITFNCRANSVLAFTRVFPDTPTYANGGGFGAPITSSSQFQVLVNGSIVTALTELASTAPRNSWDAKTYAFGATAGTHTVTFQLIDTTDGVSGKVAVAIENIRVSLAREGDLYLVGHVGHTSLNSVAPTAPWRVSGVTSPELSQSPQLDSTLNIPSHGSGTNDYDTTIGPINCSGIEFNWAAQSGFAVGSSHFKVLKDSSTLLDITTLTTTYWHTSSYTFTPGSYTFTFRLHDVSSSTDVAMAVESIRFKGYTATLSSERTVFQVQGTGDGIFGGTPFTLAANFTLRDLTLDGSLLIDSTDGTLDTDLAKPVRWLYFDRAAQVRMENVLITNTYGTGVRAEMLWDSYFENVQFANCGIPDKTVSTDPDPKPSMYFGCFTGDTPGPFNSCNNVKLISCRWEADQYIACLLDQYTRLVYFIGGKWHGKLIGDDGAPLPVTCPHIDILPNWYGIGFDSARMTNWANTHLRAIRAASLAISGSMITNAGVNNAANTNGMFGVALFNCAGCAITGNVFPAAVLSNIYSEPLNRDGNVLACGRGNVVAGNGAYDFVTPMILNDEFINPATTSGAIGELGWTTDAGTAPSAPVITPVASSTNHPGVINVQCAASGGGSGDGKQSGMLLANISVDPTKFFAMTFILRCTNSSSGDNVGFSFGLAASSEAGHVLRPSNSICFLKYDAVTTWVGFAKAGGASGTATATVANVDQNFHYFTFYRKDATTIAFSIDGGTEQTLNATIPTTSLVPFLCFGNLSTSTARSIDFDSMELSRPNGA